MPINPATATTHSRAGLLAGAVPIPLEGVTVHAVLNSISARVVVTQRYRNHEAHPLEAVYVFPLDEGAAVCGFEAISGGVHYVGEVMPREKAFKAYDDALQDGHGAYLLDEERPDVFTASVGNVLPGAEVLLRLTYVAELRAEGGGVRFTLPTTVSPRYAPAEDCGGVGRSQDATLNPPTDWAVPYGLDLTVDLTMPGAITRVESPSHPISLSLAGTRATVTLAHADVALDRDVVVLVEAEGLQSPHAVIERDGEGRYAAAIAFRPTFERGPAPAEVVFLIDRSGSMKGTSIAEVRNTLQLCLRSLPSGSRFDIVGFGSTFESLFGQCLPYDEPSLARASAHIDSLDADLGGTEILPALEFVLKQEASATMPRQLVVFTDGQVTNTDAILKLVSDHAATTRVFAFGIGRGASAHLVSGMARAGKGAAEFIHPGERIEAKVLRQFGRLLAPALTDVGLAWNGLRVTPAPTTLPPVFAGDRLIAYGLLEDVKAATVVLSGRGPEGPVSFGVALDPAGVTAGSTLATLAARTLIRELEESPDGLSARGSKQLERKADGVTREIVRLATTYGLASRETSFIAIEQRDAHVEGPSVLRSIPVALTSGWGQMGGRPARPQLRLGLALGVDFSIMPGAAGAAGLRPGSARVRFPPQGRRPLRPETGSRSRDFVDVDRLQAMLGAGGLGAQAAGSSRDFDRVVALQRADGSWDLTAAMAAACGIALARLEAGVPAAVSTTPDPRRVWATLLALAWLVEHAGDARDEWRLLALKAEQWLSDRAGNPSTLANWQEEAARVVRNP